MRTLFGYAMPFGMERLWHDHIKRRRLVSLDATSWCYYALIMSVNGGRTDSDDGNRGKVIELSPKI